MWIDPAGVITPLDVDWEASGRFMPDVTHEEDGVPGQPGARHRASRFKPHEFTLKVTLATADEPSLRVAQRALVSAMDPTRGEGTIRVTSTIGDVREIRCYYSAGLGMEEKLGNSGPDMQQAAILFRAYDPYWRPTSDTSQSFTIGVGATFFPFFPLRLTSSEIAVDTTITNTGDDANVWPTWTIRGPGGVIKLRNFTTGKNLIFTSTTLGVGEFVTVDTRPGRKTVTRQDGTSLFADLDPTSALWPLQTGANAVRLEMTGATPGASALTVNYRPGYLSP